MLWTSTTTLVPLLPPDAKRPFTLPVAVAPTRFRACDPTLTVVWSAIPVPSIAERADTGRHRGRRRDVRLGASQDPFQECSCRTARGGPEDLLRRVIASGSVV